ncbi:MAG: hypothetical protein KDN19_17920 [Verrucomicrobiae bacterium]|nr:hypothetical protein [Verrucomicrobiae bacterium]
MSRASTKGIFCLEGDWDRDLRTTITVLPFLELLAQVNRPPIPSIRRDIGTATEMEYYLKKWCQKRYARFPILYLGFHGDPGVLYLGGDRRATVDLDWLEESLAGKCKGRLIHFGSCGTLATHGRRLNRFLRVTGAVGVCGYKVDVDWLLAAAFEIILLGVIQQFSLTRSGLAAVDRRVRREAGGLTKDLAFRMVVAPRKRN